MVILAILVATGFFGQPVKFWKAHASLTPFWFATVPFLVLLLVIKCFASDYGHACKIMAEDYFFSTLSKFRKDDSFTVEDKNLTLPQAATANQIEKADNALVERDAKKKNKLLDNRKTRAKSSPSDNGFQTILVGYLDFSYKETE